MKRLTLLAPFVILFAFALMGGCSPSASPTPLIPELLPPAPTLTAAIQPIDTPSLPAELLPHTLYYLANGGQVFRMERDGKTVTQITSETSNVTGYDVSPADGSIAYVASNQLLLANADGSNRRVLVDGGPRDGNNPWITNPVFSPGGGTLAYGHEGLTLYDISTGVSNLVIEDQYTEPLQGEPRLLIEDYSPVRYSPDGTKLLIALGQWEIPPLHAVYYPDTGSLVRYAEVQDYINCCSYHGGPVWSPDSSSFYGVASVHDICCLFGELWRVDAGDGSVTRMLRAGTGTMDLPKELFLAPDGLLYFFFGTYQMDSGFWDAPVLELVRSTPDDVTNRTVLGGDNFVLMNEALWAPDASFVIVSMSPDRYWNQQQEGGVLELVYTDGQKDVVWFAPLGYQMKWGRN